MGVSNNPKSLDPYFITGFTDAEGSYMILEQNLKHVKLVEQLMLDFNSVLILMNCLIKINPFSEKYIILMYRLKNK